MQNPRIQVPVTILTGFLGSGKTTLLNYILKQNHGKKIAVIENEFGEVGVDDALVRTRNAKFAGQEVIIDMANGCVCCTVRGDLIQIFKKLQKRTDRFDRIILETTGMADPAPVCQTFFVDEDIKKFAKIDAVITVVDAKHFLQHVKEVKPEGVENEAVEQIAFADRVVLNKVDLVDERQLAAIESEIKTINSGVHILRTQLAGADDKDPDLDLDSILGVDAFNIQKILESEPDFLSEDSHEHQHDKSISSVGFRFVGQMNWGKLQEWIGDLVRDKGNDLYRYKVLSEKDFYCVTKPEKTDGGEQGLLSIKGMDRKFVFQGVHMIFDGSFADDWGEGEVRESRFCFIGKNLDRDKITGEFMGCEVKESHQLRFKVADLVQCRIRGGWMNGRVLKLWDLGNPYRVQLETGDEIWASDDIPSLIKMQGS